MTTLSIGTILTFITDSCRLVVTLSKYSICSFTLLFLSPTEAETSEFFAIINSLTKFMSTSNFSMSTRTVRLTTGLETGAFFSFGFTAAGWLAGLSAAGALSFSSATTSGTALWLSTAATAPFTGTSSNKAPCASSISETLRTDFNIVSKGLSEI